MANAVSVEEVLRHNHLPQDTDKDFVQDNIDEAQCIIDERLGSSFAIANIEDNRKSFYYNAIKKQTFLLMLEVPAWTWKNENARIENYEEKTPDNRKSEITILQDRIDYYISKLIEEMEDDSTTTDEIDEYIKVKGMGLLVVGGDEDYYPENDLKKYPEGANE